LLLRYKEIIEHLTKVEYIRDTCGFGGNLKLDLFQHIWLKILEMPQDKIEMIYSKGYLQFYIYRMIINEARNPANPFLKSLKLNCEELKTTEIEYKEYDQDLDGELSDKVIKIKEELEKLFWYDKAIFEYYVEFGSLRKVAAQTGIKYGAIHQTVKKVKRIINENINSRR